MFKINPQKHQTLLDKLETLLAQTTDSDEIQQIRNEIQVLTNYFEQYNQSFYILKTRIDEYELQFKKIQKSTNKTLRKKLHNKENTTDLN